MPVLISFSHPMRGENRGFVSSCEWVVVATPPRQCGPQVQASWHHGGHGAADVVGPVAPPGRASGRGWGRRSVHRLAKAASWSRFGGICVHCCDASCDASCVEWHERLNHHGVLAAPLGGHPSLNRATRLCASGAVARLASSRDVNPQTPEKPENSLVPPNKTVRLAGEMSRA